MSDTLQFEADDRRLAAFSGTAGDAYRLQGETASRYHLELYDTFDWRLYRRGLFAWWSGGSLSVGSSFGAHARLKCEVTRMPAFWWEFESGQAGEFLKEIVGVRALLSLAEMTVEEDPFSARNVDGKIVCRWSTLTCDTGGEGERRYLLLKPLRGYDRERDRMISIAAAAGMEPLARPLPEDLLLAHGKTPGDYTSKLDLKLRRKMSVSEAAVLINRNLLSTMMANVNGIIEDLDTEFLHDFRVATRRTRSFISQFKGALPPGPVAAFVADFREVARRCNVLRDLDVYLLEKERCYGMLPEDLHPGLDEYFGYVRRRRKREHGKFSRYLGTEGFRAVLEGWEAVLDDPVSLVDRTPVERVASDKILARHRKAERRGRKITGDSPDADLHSLRIECKKLRYLLEFFSSCYPAREMSALVQHLKGLQDNLGEFNDLTVQRRDLVAYLERPARGSRSGLESAAIGGLLTALHARQDEVRGEFHRRFEEFDSDENRSMYSELFRRGRR